MNEDWIARIVDEQLRFLRGEGSEPDVSGLSDDERAEVAELLQLMEALADSLPSAPPIEEDPVAIRLGLVPGGPGSPGPSGPPQPTDPIAVSTDELRYRFGGAVEVDHLIPRGGDEPWVPVALCRALAENVLVVASYDAGNAPSIDEANVLLHHDPSLTAIVFTTSDATGAAVVEPGDAGGRLVPQEGWQQPGVPTLEPLGVALGRYFDRSIPRWDAVASLPRGELFDEVGFDPSTIVDSVFRSVAASRPQLTHRRQARDFVAALDPSIAVEWAEGVRQGRTGGDDVASAIRVLCQEASP